MKFGGKQSRFLLRSQFQAVDNKDGTQFGTPNASHRKPVNHLGEGFSPSAASSNRGESAAVKEQELAGSIQGGGDVLK